MLGNIAKLEAIRHRCAADLPLTPEMQLWLARSIGRYLGHDCDSLNEAFGVTQAHGGVPWWRERGMRVRDEALRAMARIHFAELSTYARAKTVARLSVRYETCSWPRDQLVDVVPERYLGTPKEQLWVAFQSEAKMPVSERRLRTILAE